LLHRLHCAHTALYPQRLILPHALPRIGVL